MKCHGFQGGQMQPSVCIWCGQEREKHEPSGVTDLKQRAEAFRREWFVTDEGDTVDLDTENDREFKKWFIAELKFARENPPTNVRPQHGWQSALNHVLSLLGASEPPQDGGKHEEEK